jgi:endonuclease-3
MKKTTARKMKKPMVKRRSRSIAKAQIPAHTRELYARLRKLYPDAHVELDYTTPLELLIATILSAQCTDKRVNMVTPVVFHAFPSAQALADADPAVMEEMIKSTGFFRNKTKSLIALGKALVERHNGQVPDSMAELVRLPGVGRKTANVILGNAFGKNEGVVVDTHVGRLAVRLGLTRQTDPVKAEQDLMALIGRDDWTMLAHVLIFHGRRVCFARSPQCGNCTLVEICPSSTI